MNEPIPLTLLEKCKLFIFSSLLFSVAFFLAKEYYFIHQREGFNEIFLVICLFIFVFIFMGLEYLIDLISGHKNVMSAIITHKKTKKYMEKTKKYMDLKSVVHTFCIIFKNMELSVSPSIFDKVETGDLVRVWYTSGTKEVHVLEILKKKEELSYEENLNFHSDKVCFDLWNCLTPSIYRFALISSLIVYLWCIESTFLILLPPFLFMESFLIIFIGCIFLFFCIENGLYLPLIIPFIFVERIREVIQAIKKYKKNKK